MKKYLLSFAVLMAGMSLTTACSSDDDEPATPVTETVTPYHFDLTVTVGKQGGMGRDVTTIMLTRDSLSGGPVVNFQNVGAEINADYTMETIVRGKYYYQVPVSADRFLKFQFKDNRVVKVQEQPFKQNTYNARNYTHAWLSDSILVVMAANGDADKIVWTKLNTNDMSIVAEGTLDVALSEGYKLFTTSGVLAYRESDNRLFYFYYQKTAKRNGKNEKNFHVTVVNAATMAVEQNNVCPIEAEMAASAYGELLQQTIFFDENDNLYIACFTDGDMEEGKLLRIKKGAFNIDASYNGFPNADGKLLTVQYMGGGKVFAYSRNDAAGTTIDSYSHYYSVVDLNAATRTRMAVGGTEIPYSSGRFSQRSAFDAKAGKMYFGVNTETAAPCVYVYDVKTGSLSKGVDIQEGYYFEQIRLVEGDSYTVTK